MAETSKHPARGRVILIDQDVDTRRMMKLLLGIDFKIDTASSAEDGLALVESEAPFDIVISSFTLPGMNGVAFLRRVGEKYPETVRILLTGGCTDMIDLNFAVSKGYISRFVLKPFRVNALLDQLNLDLANKRLHPA